ncbi:YnfC family lipoprotein, partial [Citrobacter sp. Awk 4]|uniref:YnfC family lipoprotein n=1 Tax=Citrobacter sp. Awk 4 TaxID=2963955 RepID=UPI00230424D7
MSLDLKMKKISTLFLCTSLFSSMALAESHYMPLLYNLSTMFDFNPVKGAVKSLDTDVEENGKVTYKIAIRLDKNGCVESLDLDNISSGHETVLKNSNGSLIGQIDGKPFSI